MQIDELDLAWEDEERPRHRRRAGGRSPGRTKKKGSGGKTFLAFFFSLVVVAALAFGAYVGVDKVKGLFSAPDYNGGGSGEVTVEILKDQFAADIAVTLHNADVVKSTKAFIEAAKNDDRSKKLQPGFYKLRKQMRAVDALSLMLDPSSRVVNRVTLPEGLTYQEAFVKLSEVTKIPVADFEAAAKDTATLGIADTWFVRQDGKQVAKTIEGFLFPATYDFPPNVKDAVSVLKLVVAKFNAEMTKLDFLNTVSSTLHISPFEALIAGSIAQVEGLDKDQAKIVRVLYNRAYGGKFPCKCLGLDSTVNYWLKITGKSARPSTELLNSQLHNPNDPYNTHDVAGLPIGPISSPGESALTAAMSPAAGGMLYFMAIDKAGDTAFADTYAQHQANQALAKKNGVQ